MRTGLAYTSARILLLVVSLVLLYLAGARGLMLLVLAFVVSALASYVLLSKQRDVMSSALSTRLSKTGQRAAEFRRRLEEGAAAEDGDHVEDVDHRDHVEDVNHVDDVKDADGAGEDAPARPVGPARP